MVQDAGKHILSWGNRVPLGALGSPGAQCLLSTAEATALLSLQSIMKSQAGWASFF